VTLYLQEGSHLSAVLTGLCFVPQAAGAFALAGPARLFGVGSLVAAFAQGVLFGGLLCGITVHDERFAGATWDFFGHGYGVLTGLATVALFCLAGAAMLRAKTVGALRDQMAGLVRPLTVAAAWAVTLSATLLPVATSARLHLDGVDRWLPFGYAYANWVFRRLPQRRPASHGRRARVPLRSGPGQGDFLESALTGSGLLLDLSAPLFLATSRLAARRGRRRERTDRC
jgi:Cytochrome bd terminal oxidase subunit II